MFELTKEEKLFLLSLNEHHVRFMIVGLTAAVLQSAHVVTQDIDLWVENLGSDEFVKAVNKVGGFYIPPGIVAQNPPTLGPGSLKIFDLVTHMHGLESFDKEFRSARTVEVSGIKLCILPLERIIHSKETANREKDKISLPALKATLATLKIKK